MRKNITSGNDSLDMIYDTMCNNLERIMAKEPTTNEDFIAAGLDAWNIFCILCNRKFKETHELEEDITDLENLVYDTTCSRGKEYISNIMTMTVLASVDEMPFSEDNYNSEITK